MHLWKLCQENWKQQWILGKLRELKKIREKQEGRVMVPVLSLLGFSPLKVLLIYG